MSVNTYLRSKRLEWIESRDRKVADLLSEIVAGLLNGGAILADWERERQEEGRRRRQEEASRREQLCLLEIDRNRWARFRTQADNWHTYAKLLPFIAELRTRLKAEGDVMIEDRRLSEWIKWAEHKAQALDPFHRGTAAIFASDDE